MLDHLGLLSGRFRVTFTCPNATPNQLDTALERTLSIHDILRTLAVRHGSLHHSHVVIRPSSRWFEHAITIAESVGDLEDFRTLVLSRPKHENITSSPAPPFQSTVSFMESQGSAAFIVYGNHSVFDATSLSMFLEDLQSLLIDESAAIPPRTPYRLFANAYYSRRASLQSQISLKHHVSRRRGIAKLRDALWPTNYSSQALEDKGTSHGHDESSPKNSCDHILLEGRMSKGVKGLYKTRQGQPNEQTAERTQNISCRHHKNSGISPQHPTDRPISRFARQHSALSLLAFPRTATCRLPTGNPMDIPGPTIDHVFKKVTTLDYIST